MNGGCRWFGILLLICVAGLALFLAGCGSSSKSSNQPMDMTAGTWTFKITPSSGNGGTITASFKTFACSQTDIALGPDYVIPGPMNATVCMSTTTISGMGSEAIILGVGANPVPANSTTTVTQGYIALQDNSGNHDAFDITGTFTASSKSASGSYTPDPSCINGCPGQVSGTFTGTMN